MVGVLESSSPRPAARVLWAHPAATISTQQTFWALLAGTSLLALGTPWLGGHGILQPEAHEGVGWPAPALAACTCAAFSAGWVIARLLAAVLDAVAVSPLSSESARSSSTGRTSCLSVFTHVTSVLPWSALLTGIGLAIWPLLQHGLLLGPRSLPFVHAALLSVLQVAGAGGRHSWIWPIALGACHGLTVLRDFVPAHKDRLWLTPSSPSSTLEACIAATDGAVDGQTASTWLQQAMSDGTGSNCGGSMGQGLGAWLHVSEDALVYALLGLVVLLCSPLLASTLNTVVMDSGRGLSGRKKEGSNKAVSRVNALSQAEDWPPVNSTSEPSFSEIPGQKMTPLERLLDSGASSVMSGSDDPFRFLSSDLLQGQRGSFTGTPPATPSPLASFPGDTLPSPAAQDPQPTAKPASPAVVQHSLLLLRLADAGTWLAISVVLSARYMMRPVAPALLSLKQAGLDTAQSAATANQHAPPLQQLLGSPWGMLSNSSALEPLCLVGCMFITCGCVGLVLLEAYVTMLMDQGMAKHHPKAAISTAGFALALVAKSALLLLVPPGGMALRLSLLLGLLISTLALGATARMHVPSTWAALVTSVPVLLLAGSTPHCTPPCACCTWAAAALLPVVLLHATRTWGAAATRVLALGTSSSPQPSHGYSQSPVGVHTADEGQVDNMVQMGQQQYGWAKEPAGLQHQQQKDASSTSASQKPNWHQLPMQPQPGDGVDGMKAAGERPEQARRGWQDQAGPNSAGVEEQIHSDDRPVVKDGQQQGDSGRLSNGNVPLRSIPEEDLSSRSRRASSTYSAAHAVQPAAALDGQGSSIAASQQQGQPRWDKNLVEEGDPDGGVQGPDQQSLITRHSAPPRMTPPSQQRLSLDAGLAVQQPSGQRRSFMESLQARYSKASSEPHEGQQRLSMDSGGLDLQPEDAQALQELQDAASAYDQLLSRAGRGTSGLAPPNGWPDAQAAANVLGYHQQQSQSSQAAALAAAAAGVYPRHHAPVLQVPHQHQQGIMDIPGVAYAQQVGRPHHSNAQLPQLLRHQAYWSGPLPRIHQQVPYSNSNVQQLWDGSYVPATNEPLIHVGNGGSSPPGSQTHGVSTPAGTDAWVTTSAQQSGEHVRRAGVIAAAAHAAASANSKLLPSQLQQVVASAASGSSVQGRLAVRAQDSCPAWPQTAGSNKPTSSQTLPITAVPTKQTPQPLESRPLTYRPHQDGRSAMAPGRQAVSMPNGPGYTRSGPKLTPRHWAEKLNMACERLMTQEPRQFHSMGPGMSVPSGFVPDAGYTAGPQDGRASLDASQRRMAAAGHPAGMAPAMQAAASPFQQGMPQPATQQGQTQAAPRYIKRGPYSGGLHKLPDAQVVSQQRTAPAAGTSVQLAAAVSAPQQLRRPQSSARPGKSGSQRAVGMAPGGVSGDHGSLSPNVTAAGLQPQSRSFAVTTRSSNASRQSTLASIPEFGMLSEEQHNGLVWVTTVHNGTGVLPPRRTASWGSMAAAAESSSKSSSSNSGNTSRASTATTGNVNSNTARSMSLAAGQALAAAAMPGAGPAGTLHSAATERGSAGSGVAASSLKSGEQGASTKNMSPLPSPSSLHSGSAQGTGQPGLSSFDPTPPASAPLRPVDVAALMAAAAGLPSMSDPGSGQAAWAPRQTPASSPSGTTQPAPIKRPQSSAVRTSASGEHGKSIVSQGGAASQGGSQRPQLFNAADALRRMTASRDTREGQA